MQTTKLLVTYCLVIPIGLTVVVLFMYPLNVGFLSALIQAPRRGYFINFVITRFVIEFFCLLTFAIIVAGAIYAPRWFDEQSAEAFRSASDAFRWCMNGVAIVLPTFVLLFFRSRFVHSWRVNAEQER